MKIASNYPLYEVSEDGRVFNKKTKKELKQVLNPLTGYKEIRVYDKFSKPYKITVHKIVAHAYLIPIEGKTKINHKDSNRLNNYYLNLEWCTSSENNRHAYLSGNKLPPWKGKFGKDNPKSKPIKYNNLITGETGTYESIGLAKKADLTEQLIINCCKGIKKSYKDCTWQYL